MHRISILQARRLAISAQCLADADGPGDVVDLVQRIGCLPIDMTAAVAPSPHLVAWGRLRSSYRTEDLADALAARELWEDFDAIRPRRDLALHLALMSRPPRYQETSDWLEANELFRAEILDALADSPEPLLSKKVHASPQVPWRSSGWNENRSVALMLQILQGLGEVAIDGRVGNQRRWTLAERVYGSARPVQDAESARAELDVRRLRGLGIARSTGTAIPGEPVHVGEAGAAAEVEGVDGEWRIDPDAWERAADHKGRAALLSPFDALVRDRVRLQDLFGFDYVLEMYKPAAQRRWGYFALPILYDDRLVGKLDATADRRAGRLFVDAVHEEGRWSARCRRAVSGEIDRLADWLDLTVTRARPHEG